MKKKKTNLNKNKVNLAQNSSVYSLYTEMISLEVLYKGKPHSRFLNLLIVYTLNLYQNGERAEILTFANTYLRFHSMQK